MQLRHVLLALVAACSLYFRYKAENPAHKALPLLLLTINASSNSD